MGVYIKGEGLDYSAMRGPCPEGFHIPAWSEWQSLISLLTQANIIGSGSSRGSNSYNILKTALKLPLAGMRAYDNAVVANVGGVGDYWTCTPTGDWVYKLEFTPTELAQQTVAYRSYGFSIRPFYDTTINPMDGEILKDGWEYLDGETMMGNVCARNPTLKVISVVYNGNQVITIADRNLGATTTYDWDIYGGEPEPTLNEANCGKHYQRGNNYGFSFSGSVTTSTTMVNASTYGPYNNYYSSTFIKNNDDWSSVKNDNLRGGETGTKPLMLNIENAYVGSEYINT